MNIVSVKINNDYEDRIKKIIQDSNVAELNTYYELLPKRDLQDAGFDYMNRFYKEMAKLEKEKAGNTLLDSKIEKKQKFLYFAYLEATYKNIYPTFKEFKTYSVLLVTAFDDYNPNIKRDDDNHPFVASDGNPSISAIVNAIAYDHRHSEHPHAFEFDKTKLDTVKEIISDRMYYLLDRESNEYKSDDYIKYIDSLKLPYDTTKRLKKTLE